MFYARNIYRFLWNKFGVSLLSFRISFYVFLINNTIYILPSKKSIGVVSGDFTAH